MELENLPKTQLFDLHVRNGAKMVPFAGYQMPVQYKLGVKKEHLHTREKAGIFDISHMGQLIIKGNNVEKTIEKVLPADLSKLKVGRQKYSFLMNDKGGIIDDLMIARYEGFYMLVLNASRKAIDIEHIKANAAEEIEIIELNDRSLIALQGPEAVEILNSFISGVDEMKFMDTKQVQYQGNTVYISRSGYTGEDGYEISVVDADIESFVEVLLKNENVELIGLGARDSLRLEAGLCLYGNDLDEETTALEADLKWAISPSRRKEDSPEYIGKSVVVDQILNETITKKRVGLLSLGKAPLRENVQLFSADDKNVGIIKSGTFSPCLGKPISMAYVQPELANIGTKLFAELRGKKQEVEIVTLPFVPHNYKR